MKKKYSFTVRLIGGLGNQLFQIQFANYLKGIHNVELVYDNSYLLSSKKSHEHIAFPELIKDCEIITLSHFELYCRRPFERMLFKLKINFLFKIFCKYIFSDNQIHKLKIKNYVIDGFWQNKFYINDDFINKLRHLIIPVSILKIDNIVCLHIRRGDYLTNKSWGKVAQQVLSQEYYDNAISFFDNKLGNKITFHIYTDDEEWARKIYIYDKIKFQIVSTNELSPLSILQKMSSYKYYIISNSTLSWWAAVISHFSDKTIVCPRYWQPGKHLDELILDDWITL